jgi:hypothetical protein
LVTFPRKKLEARFFFWTCFGSLLVEGSSSNLNVSRISSPEAKRAPSFAKKPLRVVCPFFSPNAFTGVWQVKPIGHLEPEAPATVDEKSGTREVG